MLNGHPSSSARIIFINGPSRILPWSYQMYPDTTLYFFAPGEVVLTGINFLIPLPAANVRKRLATFKVERVRSEQFTKVCGPKLANCSKHFGTNRSPVFAGQSNLHNHVCICNTWCWFTRVRKEVSVIRVVLTRCRGMYGSYLEAWKTSYGTDRQRFYSSWKKHWINELLKPAIERRVSCYVTFMTKMAWCNLCIFCFGVPRMIYENN